MINFEFLEGLDETLIESRGKIERPFETYRGLSIYISIYVSKVAILKFCLGFRTYLGLLYMVPPKWCFIDT